MREARAWFVREFNPATVEELAALAAGPKNPWIRMVVGYWEMAASLVVHGAIHRDMFLASSAEMLTTFAKLEPFLGPLREDTPGTLKTWGRLFCARSRASTNVWRRCVSSFARQRPSSTARNLELGHFSKQTLSAPNVRLE